MSTAQQPGAIFSSYETSNGLAPIGKPGERGKPRTIPLQIDFTTNSTINLDLRVTPEVDQIEFVQSIFVDNSNNPNSVSIKSEVTNETLKVPGGSQAYLPFLVPTQPKFSFTSTGAVAINIQLMNFAVPALVWTVNGGTGGGSTGTDHSATPTTDAANLLVAIAANPSRSNIYVQNQSNEQIQVKLLNGGGTATYILLQSGGANSQGASWNDPTYKGAIQIRGVTAGDQVAAYET